MCTLCAEPAPPAVSTEKACESFRHLYTSIATFATDMRIMTVEMRSDLRHSEKKALIEQVGSPALLKPDAMLVKLYVYFVLLQ